MGRTVITCTTKHTIHQAYGHARRAAVSDDPCGRPLAATRREPLFALEPHDNRQCPGLWPTRSGTAGLSGRPVARRTLEMRVLSAADGSGSAPSLHSLSHTPLSLGRRCCCYRPPPPGGRVSALLHLLNVFTPAVGSRTRRAGARGSGTRRLSILIYVLVGSQVGSSSGFSAARARVGRLI
jgi:hypothetical protein